MKASPRCFEWNVNDVMKKKSLEGVSCKLSLPRDKSHNVMYVYAKGYPISRWNKSQIKRKMYMSMHNIIL
jgi:hypothetical protein